MEGLTVLILLLMIPLALWMIADPRGMWKTTSAWQFRNPKANEPSDTAYALQRVAGIFLVVTALVCVSLTADRDGTPTSRSSPTRTSTYTYQPPLWQSPGPHNDGYANHTVRAETVDPFSSASHSPVGAGEPVTLLTPVITDTQGKDESESATQLSTDRIYYPWTPTDHPPAFASANVIDSRTALSTLDLEQATTPGAGAEALGEGYAIIVRLGRAVCAISSVKVSTPGTTTSTSAPPPSAPETASRISVAVYGVTDTTRCGQTTEGAYVAVPLSDDLVAAARSYQAPDYQPIDTTEQRKAWSSVTGQYAPTAFRASPGAGWPSSEETWKDPETDQNLAEGVLVPWLPAG